MLNLKHLYYYHVFAQKLSTTKAAKALGITAPALSNQLKQLEQFVGAPLTRRIDGKVVITDHGEMVLHYAERMFSAYDELKIKLASSQDSKMSSLRVGVCQNLGARFSFDLLSLIEHSNLSRPQKVQIIFEAADKLMTGFMKNEFDLIFGAFASGVSWENERTSQHLDFPVRLFAPPRLLDMQEVKERHFSLTEPTQIIELANSSGISLVLPMQPSILRDETERFLANPRNLRPKTIECNHSSAIVQLIERGFAMGFLPTPCLLDFKSASMLTTLGPTAGYWSHRIWAFTQKGSEISMSQNLRLADIFSPPGGFN